MKKKMSIKKWFSLILGLSVALLLVAVSYRLYQTSSSSRVVFSVPHSDGESSSTVVLAASTANNNPAEGGDVLITLQNSFRNVASRILPSVIEIHGQKPIVGRPSFSSFFFFDLPQNSDQRERIQRWAGSGVIVGKEENKQKYYALTNAHVIQDARELEIIIHQGEEPLKASVVGSDPKKDLALITFESASEVISVAPMGDSDVLQVGDWVVAVGSPLEYSFTVTAGIVSAVDRSVNPSRSGRTQFIQTDAAINQGNSGGPLVNLRGEVVGINTAIASYTGGNIGLGFALPINVARASVESFLKGESLNSGWLGIEMAGPPGEDFLTSLGYPADQEGAFVASITLGAPAEKAGIRPGDLIIRGMGQTIRTSRELFMLIDEYYSGETLDLVLLRGKEEISLQVNLEKRPSEEELKKNSQRIWPGAYVYPLTDEVRRYFNLRNWMTGVLVESISLDSPAARAGLKERDVITHINGQIVSSLQDFYRLIQGRSQNLRLLRSGKELELTLRS